MEGRRSASVMRMSSFSVSLVSHRIAREKCLENIRLPRQRHESATPGAKHGAIRLILGRVM